MSEKVITLPEAEEMKRRLLSVDDNSHMQQKFYPILLKQAGQERVGMDVVMMLALAIHDYTEGMPAIMSNMLYMRADEFVDALIEDEDVATEAKAQLKQALGQTA
jgi:hypothetical protein